MPKDNTAAVYTVDIEAIGPVHVGESEKDRTLVGPFFLGETVEDGTLPAPILASHLETGAIRPATDDETRRHRAGEVEYRSHLVEGQKGAAAGARYGAKAPPPGPGATVVRG